MVSSAAASRSRRILSATCWYYPRPCPKQPILCCVKCNSILDRATFQGLEVDLCPKCGGLWLDRGEITRAAKLPEQELVRLRVLLTRRDRAAAGPDREQGPLPRLPGQPGRGPARQRSRRLLRQAATASSWTAASSQAAIEAVRARVANTSRTRSSSPPSRPSRRSLIRSGGSARPHLDPAAADDAFVAVVEHGAWPGADAEGRLVEAQHAAAVRSEARSRRAPRRGVVADLHRARGRAGRIAGSRRGRIRASARRPTRSARGPELARADHAPRRWRRRCAARSAARPRRPGTPRRWPMVKWCVPAWRPSAAPVARRRWRPAAPAPPCALDEGDVVAVGDEADLLRVGLVGVGQAGAARERAHLVLASCRRAGTRRAPATRGARRTGSTTGPCRDRARAPSTTRAVGAGREARVVPGGERRRADRVGEAPAAART